MVTHNPHNSVWPVTTARNRRVTWASGGAFHLFIDLRNDENQFVVRISLALADLITGKLASGYWIHALDALCHIAVSNALHFKFVQAAKIGNLLERKGGVFNQPNGSGFRHQ